MLRNRSRRRLWKQGSCPLQLPSLKQLKAEREDLISEKAQFYQKYREAHKVWLELSTAQQNLEALHRAEGRREMTRGGLHELDK